MNRKRTGRTMKIGRKASEQTKALDPEQAALAHLKRVQPELYAAARPYAGTILSRVSPKRRRQALFERLITSIVNQQLSTKAAASIFARLKNKLANSVTPASILAASPALLRSAGLSQAKVESIQEIAKAVDEQNIDLLALKRLPPEEAVARLTQLRGVGPWTAEMFLIFALGAPDVFSPGDLILARRLQKLFALKENASKKEMAKLAERWSPHRSFVSLLFWRLHHAELEAGRKQRP